MTNQDIKLNAWDLNYESQIAVQGEVNSRTLTVTLIDKLGTDSYISNAQSVDRPVNLTDVTARLYVKKGDGTKTFSYGVVTDAENGVVDFLLPGQATTYVGKNPCQILLTKADNSALKITGLTLDVQESDLEGAIESTDDFSALVVALNSISTSVTSAATAVINCNTATTAANTATTNANAAATNANTKATLANTATTAANTARDSADTAATNANSKATLADQKATLADAAALRANTAAGEIDAALAGTVDPLVNSRIDARVNVASGIVGIGSDGKINNAEFMTVKNQVVNVKNFGTNGVAIQAAIDFAKVNSGEVYIPEGTYLITSIIKVPSNMMIIMSTNTILKRNANINSMMMNDSDGTVGEYKANENIAVIGGVFDANKAEYATLCTSLTFGHANRIKVIGTKFINNYDWHMIELNAVKDATVESCYFKDYGTDTTGSEMLQLDLMYDASTFPWFGPYDNTTCNNILITECRFENGKKGIGGHTAITGYKHTNVIVSNCYFESLSSDAAIYMQNYQNVIIKDNTFTDCYIGIHIMALDNCENFTIEGNTLYDMRPTNVQSRAIQITGTSGGTSLTNGEINNNKIRSTGGHGIGIDFCSGWAVTNNSVETCGGVGIWFYGTSKGSMCNNTATGNCSNVASSGRGDIYIGEATPAAFDVIVSGNVVDKIGVPSAAQRIIITNNFANTSILTTSDDATNLIKKFNNFVAGVWIV